MSSALELPAHDGAARPAAGVVYTPRPIADLVLELATEGAGECGAAPSVDVGTGRGVFMIAMVEHLAEQARAAGRAPDDPASRGAFLDMVGARVWGVDIDGESVDLARRACLRHIASITGQQPPRGFLQDNVVVADFLRESFDDFLTGLPAPPRLFVGNPPYVTVSSIPESDREDLRLRFPTSGGRLDLYTLFMERAARLLPEGGRFAFITPDKWLASLSARALRTLLAEEGSLTRVGLFDSHRVFPEAATVPAITVWTRGEAPKTARVEHYDIDPAGSPRVTATSLVDSGVLLAGPGLRVARTSTADDLTSRMLGMGRPLADHVARLSAGPATGLNRAFLVDPGEVEIEPELLHRVARGRDVSRHAIADPRLRLLLPYASPGFDRLVDLTCYPLAHKWLRRHESALRGRHCVRAWGKSWYALHDSAPRILRHSPKIVFPDVARSNRFAFDREGAVLPLHSAYYLVPRSLDGDVLTAVLNSRPAELFLRTHAPRAKDGFTRFRRQFVLQLPIPELDRRRQQEIKSLVRSGEEEAAAALAGAAYRLDATAVDEAWAALLPPRPRERHHAS